MHITSLQYAAGDITRKRRAKDKSRVSELLQGLTFFDDSEAGEGNESEMQPERKKLKVSSVPEKSWTKRDIKPNFPSWSALDSGLSNLKSEKLNPIELFELFFDDDTFNLIVNETNNYASQKNVSLEVTVQEMRVSKTTNNSNKILQTAFEVGNPSAASQTLGSQVSATMPGLASSLK